jgi:hypothetical protein
MQGIPSEQITCEQSTYSYSIVKWMLIIEDYILLCVS